MKKLFFSIVLLVGIFNIFSNCLFAEDSFDPVFFSGNTNWEVATFYEGEKTRPFIFIIQDVHCNEEVQYKIAEIIKFLKIKYPKNFKIIGIEGNCGPIDTSILKDMKDKNLKMQMSKNLMKKGMMTGAEYFDIINPNKVILYGVEDITTYNKNLAQIKEGLFDDKEAEKEVELIKLKNKNSKEIFYQKDMYAFEKIEDKYEENEIQLDDFLAKCIKMGDVKDKDFVNYPNIALFLKKQNITKNIKFEELAVETAQMVSLIKKYLNKEDRINIENMVTKNGYNSEFYNYFIKLLNSKNLIVDKKFRQFNLYMNYSDVNRRINNVELLNEVDRFVFFIKNRIAKTVQEKEILYLDKYSNLFADYVNNRVSSKQRSEMNAEFSDFLKRAKIRYGEIDIEKIRKHFDLMQGFYDTAIKRNEIMVENLLKIASGVTCLIIGGFHTEGIEELLRAKGDGYLVFTPKINIDVAEGQRIYLNRMKEEKGLPTGLESDS
jgi:hypothetical protein